MTTVYDTLSSIYKDIGCWLAEAFAEYGLVFGALHSFQEFIWGFAGIFIVLSLGVYFSLRSNFMQFSAYKKAIKYIFNSRKVKYEADEISPLRAFFASLGGCVGVGNLVTISLAIHWGGPGAIFWMWLIAFFGVMLKYAEIFLGLKYRLRTTDGGYVGGPMYFLQKAFNGKTMAVLMALLMCLYGVEIFMFNVIKNTFVQNYSLDSNLVTFVLLVLILIGVKDGVKSIGAINATMIPFFIVIFFITTIWVLCLNHTKLGDTFNLIFSSAFTGHAAIGAFAGSALFSTISNGVAGACYSGDIGIGYESIMHSSAKVSDSKSHASLSFLNIFLDTFVVCTCTALIVIITGVWHTSVPPELMLQTALEQYFPWIKYIMPIFIFLLAYTTIISYFGAGLSCAKFISPKYGRQVFYVLGVITFVVFSFFGTKHAAIIMYSSGAGLMLINSIGIFKLRKEIDFH